MIIYDMNGMPVFGISHCVDGKNVEVAVWNETGNIKKRLVKKEDMIEIRDFVNFMFGEDEE